LHWIKLTIVNLNVDCFGARLALANTTHYSVTEHVPVNPETVLIGNEFNTTIAQDTLERDVVQFTNSSELSNTVNTLNVLFIPGMEGRVKNGWVGGLKSDMNRKNVW